MSIQTDMSEKNLITSRCSASNVQTETQRGEDQDFGIILYEVPFNEIQSQSDCNETVNQNGEEMTKSQHLSMAGVHDVPEMLYSISEATYLFEMTSRRRENVAMFGINASCSRDTPVTVTESNNLSTSVNTSVENNGSEILTESAEINNNQTSETSYEEKRLRFYCQKSKTENTIIISSDHDSDIASKVQEHSPFHSIADISVEHEVKNHRQTYCFSVPQDSLKSLAEFHIKRENFVADILNPTTDISVENQFNDKQQSNSSDVPTDSVNSIADIPVNAVITDQNQTNVATQILKDSLNSIANVTVDDTVADQILTTSLMDSIADILVKNQVTIEQTNSTSSNDNTERYNRDECQLNLTNLRERFAVSIPHESDYDETDSINITVKSEECKSPTKERIDVTQCNKPVPDDITGCYNSLDDDSEDSLSEAELQVQEDLLNVNCKELKVQKLQEKYYALKAQHKKLLPELDKIVQFNFELQQKMIDCKCNTKIQHPGPVQVQVQTNDNGSVIQTDSSVANLLFTPVQRLMLRRWSLDIPKMINEMATIIFTKQELVFNTATKLDLSKKLLIIKTIEELTNTRLKMSEINLRLNKKIQNLKRTRGVNSTKKRKLLSQGECTSPKKERIGYLEYCGEDVVSNGSKSE